MISLLLATALCSVEINADNAFFSDNQLSLEQNVTVNFPENTSLTCTSAFFDGIAKKLTLDTNITYTTPEFSVTCQRVLALLNAATLSLSSLDEATATGNLHIVHKNGYTIEAENATYNKEGILKLVSNCHVTHQKGDSITADSIDYNLKQKTLTFHHPKGTLATQPQPTAFEATTLTWNFDTRQLILTENVKVEQPKLGTFNATKSMTIQQDEHHDLRTLVAEGSIDITLPKERTLFSVGTLTLDHIAQKIELNGYPITFRDPHGEIEANHAILTYTLKQKNPDITSIVLSDNIKIADFATVGNIRSDTCLHYILTDHATLDPMTQTVVLKANPNKRVLLFDQVNNIQVSAPGLTVQRNAVTQKETIKGMGDVRFSFSEKELNLLKQQFKMIQNAK